MNGPVIFDYEVEVAHFAKECFFYFLNEWHWEWEKQTFLARHPQPIEDA